MISRAGASPQGFCFGFSGKSISAPSANGFTALENIRQRGRCGGQARAGCLELTSVLK
jgi:hypothetical protein